MTNSRTRRRALTVTVAAVTGGALALLPVTGAFAGGGDGHGNRHGSGHGDGQPRNVILLVGDGMAAAHREAARLDQEGFDGQLAMDSLDTYGVQTTDPRDPEATVTDSAAAATAWATGQKTYNGSISYDVDGNPLPFLGQQAADAGRATGLVTTSQVTDATPAAFFSAIEDRYLQDQIAAQYLDVEPEVVLGGGEDWWLPAGTPGAYPDAPPEDEEEGSRSEQGNLVEQAQAQGYTYVDDAAGLAAAAGGADKLLGLFANQEMFTAEPEGEGSYEPAVPLTAMTDAALDVLSDSEDGFFLVVEEEAVDEMSHANNAELMLEAMQSLDDTVELVQQYVAEHPDTLVIVTGDHECGGLTVEDVDAEDESGPGGTLPQDAAVTGETESGEDGPFAVAGTGGAYDFALDWTTTGHTGAPTPVTATGPGSEELIGQYPNTHLYDVMHSALVG